MQNSATEVPNYVAVDGLSVDDCFELGRLAYEKLDHYHAVTWLEHAYQLLQPDEMMTSSSVNRSTLLDLLALSLYEVGRHNRKEY